MSQTPPEDEGRTVRVVTANALLDGDVVYLTADGGWTRQLAEAATAETPDAAEALLALGAQPGVVVGAYLADMALSPEGALAPLHYRERIRAFGPTVRTDFRVSAPAAASPAAASPAAASEESR